MVTDLTNVKHLAFYVLSLFPFGSSILHLLTRSGRQARNKSASDTASDTRSNFETAGFSPVLGCRSVALAALLLALSSIAARAESTNTPVLTTPAPGSTLPGSSVTFTWTTDAWASTYELFLGTVVKTDNLGSYTVSPSKNDTVSVTVTGLPTNGAPIYAILSWTSSGAKHYKNYTYTAAKQSSTATLSVNSTSLAFGQVSLNNPATQQLTLSSTGTASVTVSSAAVSGAGFSVSGLTFPKTLSSGQSATLDVQFDPTAAGSATGKLVIASNSSSGSTSTVSLSGTGEAAAGYQVNLSWDASSGSDIAGYHVYRSTAGNSTYQLLNSSLDANTSYVDPSVNDGTTYDYYVESVTTSGVSSEPSSTFSIAIP